MFLALVIVEIFSGNRLIPRDYSIIRIVSNTREVITFTLAFLGLRILFIYFSLFSISI